MAVPRLLVTNGCSYTRGSELSDAPREAWPAVLANLLGARCVNLAQGGTSNRRMVRSTVLGLQRLRPPEEPAETLVVLAWTDISRHEFYAETEAVSEEAVGLAAEMQLDRHWHPIGPWRLKRRHKASRAFYSHLWTAEGQWVNFALDWLLLDSFLRSQGYMARYAFVAPPNIPPPPMASEIAGQLPGSTVWGGVPPVATMTFEGVATKVPRGPRGHPLAEGHQAFAAALHDWIRADLPAQA